VAPNLSDYEQVRSVDRYAAGALSDYPDTAPTAIWISMKAGFMPDEALRRELLDFARVRLGAVVAPKEIEFRNRLPKTRSGKIMRRLLKAQESGLPPGDTSTLEPS
jgi:acyl-coenzyme A synthetase/AMP-(fatty) acid ligase